MSPATFNASTNIRVGLAIPTAQDNTAAQLSRRVSTFYARTAGAKATTRLCRCGADGAVALARAPRVPRRQRNERAHVAH